MSGIFSDFMYSEESNSLRLIVFSPLGYPGISDMAEPIIQTHKSAYTDPLIVPSILILFSLF